jgi:tripartite-type tricarboxylate transporter receptor subunit TctC
MSRSVFHHVTVAALVLIAAAIFGSSARAQGYPSKPISIVAGFPPGGSVDTVARVIAEGLSKDLGQPVLVETKTGATGIVAANHVATAKPDGYTLLLVPGGHALYGATFKSLPFDPVESFTWISNVITTPFFITVSAQSPYRSLADIVAKGKANPNTLKFGSVGPGSPHHLGVELISLQTGAKFVHVPYRGEGPMITALQQSEIDFGIFTPIQVLGSVQSGTTRALAATTPMRSSRLPDVPTVQEALSLKDYDVASWFAIAGPAGMPADIVTRLNTSIRKTLQNEEALNRLRPIGGEVMPNSPKEEHDKVAKEAATWAVVVEKAGVQKQ